MWTSLFSAGTTALVWHSPFDLFKHPVQKPFPIRSAAKQPITRAGAGLDPVIVAMDRLASPPTRLDSLRTPGPGHSLLPAGQREMERWPVRHNRHGRQADRSPKKLQRSGRQITRGRPSPVAAFSYERLVAIGPFGLRLGKKANTENAIPAQTAGQAVDEVGPLSGMLRNRSRIKKLRLVLLEFRRLRDSNHERFHLVRQTKPFQPHLHQPEQMLGRGRRTKQSDVEIHMIRCLAVEMDLDTQRTPIRHPGHLGHTFDKLSQDELQRRPIAHRMFEELLRLEVLRQRAKATIGSSRRPAAWSQRRSNSVPNRALKSARGSDSSSPTRCTPNCWSRSSTSSERRNATSGIAPRNSSLCSEGTMQIENEISLIMAGRGESGTRRRRQRHSRRSRSCTSPVSFLRFPPWPKRAAAQAAPTVSAKPRRTTISRRANWLRIRWAKASSPSKNRATPVTSSNRQSGSNPSSRPIRGL